MASSLEVRHQVAIAGRVVMGDRSSVRCRVEIATGPQAFLDQLQSQLAQFGAAWDTMPVRFDRTETAVDGLFYFLDLPDGEFKLNVTAIGQGTRYGTATATVSVIRDADGRITLATSEISLPATTIAGQVTGPEDEPVPYAELRTKGGGARTLSDKQGKYRLVGVEAGKQPRTLVATARGFKTQEKSVSCTAGTTSKMDFSMTTS